VDAARRRLVLRLLAVALLAIALVVIGHVTGVTANLSTEKIHGLAVRSGSWGAVIYIGLFAVGLFVYVPALVFVAAGVLAWGHVYGGLLAYAGAFVGAITSFTVVRAIGGRPLGELRGARVRKILDGIERRPILTVALLRTFLLSAPALNYALALSPVGWRSHAAGTALGLVPSVAVTSVFFGVLFG